jgi:antitoxin VapB
MELRDVSEVEIRRDGNSIIITPVRKNWSSFVDTDTADEDFLSAREPLIDADRVSL